MSFGGVATAAHEGVVETLEDIRPLGRTHSSMRSGEDADVKPGSRLSPASLGSTLSEERAVAEGGTRVWLGLTAGSGASNTTEASDGLETAARFAKWKVCEDEAVPPALS